MGLHPHFFLSSENWIEMKLDSEIVNSNSLEPPGLVRYNTQKNLFEILLNQTEIRLCLSFSD